MKGGRLEHSSTNFHLPVGQELPSGTPALFHFWLWQLWIKLLGTKLPKWLEVGCDSISGNYDQRQLKSQVAWGDMVQGTKSTRCSWPCSLALKPYELTNLHKCCSNVLWNLMVQQIMGPNWHLFHHLRLPGMLLQFKNIQYTNIYLSLVNFKLILPIYWALFSL